jgi:hypothetical protein
MSTHFTWQSAVLDSDCESTTKLVLLAIGSFMNQHGTGAFPSLETLSAKTSLSKLTVMRHVSAAEAKGWLQVKKRHTKNGDRDSNLYAIRYPQGVVSPVNHVVSEVNHGGIADIPPVVSPVNRNTPVLTPQVTKKASPAKTQLPEDFGISDRVREWAAEKGHDRLQLRLEYFVGYAKASGSKYTDWDQAFMNSIRDNWAKLPVVSQETKSRFRGLK